MSARQKMTLGAGALLLLGTLGAAALLYSTGMAPFSKVAHSQSPAPAPVVSGTVLEGFVDVESGVQTLMPVQPGRVIKVVVKENDDVKAGDVLVLLDDEIAKLKQEEAEADLANAEAQLAKASAYPEQYKLQVAQQKAAVFVMERKHEAAKLKLAQAQNLHKKEFLSKEELGAAEQQVKQVEAGVQAERDKLKSLELVNPQLEVVRAKASVRAKTAQLLQAKYSVREHAIRAPVAGKVLRINVGEGDVLTASFQQPPLLFRPDQPLVIRMNVEQEFIDKVGKGYLAKVEDYANPGPQWSARVIRVGDIFMPRRSTTHVPFGLGIDNTKTLECIVALDEGQTPLRIGQRVRVTVAPGGQ